MYSASVPPSKRLRGKQPADDAHAATYAGLATAEELAHPGMKFAATTVRRKHVHWTHGRSNNPVHVQPSAFNKQEFWAHLCKVYKEVYPDPTSPTGSILAFGVTAKEFYATTPPGLCPTHKHTASFSTEQHYWNKVAKHSLQQYRVKLNAVAHDSYRSMFEYLRQPSDKKPLHTLDAEPYFSKYHPKDADLATLLVSCGKAAGLNASKRVGGVGSGAPRSARERAPRLFDVIRANGLRTVTALQAHAEKEATEGRIALAELCTKHSVKLRGYLKGALAVLDAPLRLAEEGMTRMDKLRRAAAEVSCVCGGAWQPGARYILNLNGIDVEEFCVAVCRALHLGARRMVNVGCVGAAGCGKSTLLEPFEFVFETLEKPQKGSTFPLCNLPGCDVILWQDYDHDEETVSFTDLLSLFVGESVGLRTPGEPNQKFRNKAPLFYSGRVPMLCSRRDKDAEATLNGMMDERFELFRFTVPLPKRERKADWVHCAKCCAEFYLRGGAAADVVGTPPSAATGAPLATVPVATPGGTAASSTSAVLPVASPVAPLALTAVSSAGGVAPGPSAGTPALASELEKLHGLHADGALTKEEFAAAKRVLLGL